MLRAEGHPITPGSVGENLTLAGVDWGTVVPGSCLALGADVVVQITGYTTPCRQITGSFRDGEVRRVSQPHHPGNSRVYARVLQSGRLATGDPVRLLRRDETRRLAMA